MKMPESVLETVETKMNEAIVHLEKELGKLRTGRASASLVDGIMVPYYGNPTPINQVATISIPEARQLIIKPFDRSVMKDLETALNNSDLGINPQSDGEQIRLVIPALTEDRRKLLVKDAKSSGEHSKVTLRNIRRDGIDGLKKLDLPEDAHKGYENTIQDITNTFTKKIDEIIKEKEKELLTI